MSRLSTKEAETDIASCRMHSYIIKMGVDTRPQFKSLIVHAIEVTLLDLMG